MGYVDIDLLFERDERGRIVKRKSGVWSTIADACRDCRTTVKKHEAFGYCRTCYVRLKRRTDAEWRSRNLRIAKAQSIKHADRVEAYDKERSQSCTRKAQRKAISRRWFQKNAAKWPIGSTVWHGEFRGTILETNNASALVQFLNGVRRVPFAKLSQAGASRRAA